MEFLVIADSKEIEVNFTRQELLILISSINEICHELEEWEFDIRVAVSKDKTEPLLVKMKNLLMTILTGTHLQIATQLIEDEFLILHSALNEICNGFKVSEFEIRIGANKDKSVQLLNEIGQIWDMWKYN